MTAGRVMIVVGTMVLGTAAHAGESDWHYTLGETRHDQQVNLCSDEAEALSVAEVFRSRGARPGYSALSGAVSCSRSIESVTPEKIIDSVPVEADDDGYSVSFVRVGLPDGSTTILVTTRPVE